LRGRVTPCPDFKTTGYLGSIDCENLARLSIPFVIVQWTAVPAFHETPTSVIDHGIKPSKIRTSSEIADLQNGRALGMGHYDAACVSPQLAGDGL